MILQDGCVCLCVQIKLGSHVTIGEQKKDENDKVVDDRYVARVIELYVDLQGVRRMAVQWMYRLQVGRQGNVCAACWRCCWGGWAMWAKCVDSVPPCCVWDLYAGHVDVC